MGFPAQPNRVRQSRRARVREVSFFMGINLSFEVWERLAKGRAKSLRPGQVSQFSGLISRKEFFR